MLVTANTPGRRGNECLGPDRLSKCWFHPHSLALYSNCPHLRTALPGLWLVSFPGETQKKKFSMTSLSPAPTATNTLSACTRSRLHSPLAGTSTGFDGMPSELIQIPERSELLSR